jgi:hypothetical protein
MHVIVNTAIAFLLFACAARQSSATPSASGPAFEIFVFIQESKPLVAGDTGHFILRLVNLQDSDIFIDSIVIGIGKSSIEAQRYHMWYGETKNIPVGARDTLRFLFEGSARVPGGYGTQIDIYTNAGWNGASHGFTLYPAVPFWDEYSYLFLRDCERDVEGEVAVHNYNRTSTVIDSVISFTNGWYLVEPIVNRELPGVSDYKVKVGRKKYVVDPGMFILYAKNNSPDTLFLGVYPQVIQPRLLPEADTTYIDLLPNESKFTTLIAKNVGYGGYRLGPAEYTPTETWTVQPIDTSLKIIVSATMQVILRFHGQAVEGDYPITVTLRPDMCDTFMTKTIIARVRKLSSVAAIQTQDIKIWPQPARDRLRVASQSTFEYQLLDILGIARKHGIGEAGTNEIELNNLEPGTYILRCRTGDQYFSRSVTVVR